jgi:hypothetical protein
VHCPHYSSELARTMAASVQQRIAFGERAGQKVQRIGSGFGHEGEAPTLTGPRCASVQGFSLHANTQVPAHRRDQHVVESDEESLQNPSDFNRLACIDLAVWRGRIGLLAALIGQSDLYIGYDFAGQHIAAAMGPRI